MSDEWTGTHMGVNYEIALTEWDDLQCLIHFEWDIISEEFMSLREAHAWAKVTIEEAVE